MLKLLWPALRWKDDYAFEREAVGNVAEAVLVEGVEKVTDEQWATADGILSRVDPLEVDDMGKLQRCRIFITPKVGFDNIDLKKYGALGIPVCNVPDYGTQDVADHAMGLLLSLLKGINRYDAVLRAAPSSWQQTDNPYAIRLSAARLGIVGLGRIGTAMALRCKAFGMKVSFYDPYQPNGVDLALNIGRFDSLEDLFAECDAVSLHVPLTDETRDFVNADLLSGARRGLVLINAARGEILDIDALYDALRDGVVGAAGLDVLPEEPLNMQCALVRAWLGGEDWIRHRVLLTPHSAFYTPQSAYDMRVNGIKVALKYLTTGRLENCVNEPWLQHRR